MKKFFTVVLLSTLFLVTTSYSAQSVALGALRKIGFAAAAFSPSLGVVILEDIGARNDENFSDYSVKDMFVGVGKRTGDVLRGSKEMLHWIGEGLSDAKKSTKTLTDQLPELPALPEFKEEPLVDADTTEKE